MTVIYSVTDISPIHLEQLPGNTVVVSISAAFSGTCTNECIPGVLEHQAAIYAAGADRILVVCTDGPHAINAWIKENGWEKTGLTFTSDFGEFQYRNIIGKLSKEEGKTNLPAVVGDQLRRSYAVYKEGKRVWNYVEPDTGKFTMKVENLVDALAN